MEKNYKINKLIIKDIKLATFLVLIKKNYSIKVSYDESIVQPFKWLRVTDKKIRIVNKENDETSIDIKIATVLISSAKREENSLDFNGDRLSKNQIIEEKKIKVLILDKNPNIELIVIGSESDLSKIKNKLFGGKGASDNAKTNWENYEVSGVDSSIYPVYFFYWLLKNRDKRFELENYIMKLSQVIALKDSGKSSSEINRKGSGKDMLKDEITNFIIGSANELEDLGIKILINFGNFNVIFKGSGEFEIGDGSTLSKPTPKFFNTKDLWLFSYYLYEVILPLLKEEFIKDTTWNEESKENLKKEFVLKAVKAILIDNLGYEISEVNGSKKSVVFTQ